MAPAALVRAHRRDLLALTALAGNDLRLVFARFDTADAARDGLMDLLPRLTALYGAAAATLAADWYDDLRATEKAARRFRAVPAELPDTGRTDALARWGVTPLFQAEPDKATALVKVAGGLQRIIATAGRDTVVQSAAADPGARGWQRQTAGGCSWCLMLAGRGAVYTEASADFESHDHCHCVAVPVWD